MTGLYRSRWSGNETVTMKRYGAVGNDSADDTAAFQAMFSEATAGIAVELTPGARYRVDPDTLTFPSLDRLHSGPTYGMGNLPSLISHGSLASIKPTGSGTFLFASAGYVSNAASGDAGWFLSNIEFDGDNDVAIPVIWRAYQGRIDRCVFTRGTTSAILFTRASANGTVASTYLSNNRFTNNNFRGADTTPSTGPVFATGPTSGSGTAGYGPADTWLINNYISANGADYGVHLRNTSHWLQWGNAYADAAVADLKVKNFSPGYRLNDYFEIGIAIEDVVGDGSNTAMSISGSGWVMAGDSGEDNPLFGAGPSATPFSLGALTGQTGFLMKLKDSSGTTIGGFDSTGRVVLGSASGPVVTTYAGSPENNVTAPVGSFCTDSTNGVAYVKKTGSGNTGWKLVTQAA